MYSMTQQRLLSIQDLLTLPLWRLRKRLTSLKAELELWLHLQDSRRGRHEHTGKVSPEGPARGQVPRCSGPTGPGWTGPGGDELASALGAKLCQQTGQ